jgi:hypothetical protein
MDISGRKDHRKARTPAPEEVSRDAGAGIGQNAKKDRIAEKAKKRH